MAAYAALVSLMHIIDAIQHHHSPPISLDKQQLQCLAEIVAFLQEFLEGYNSPVADSAEADPLEMRIADAAYAAEDVIESNIVEKIQLSRSKETKFSLFFNFFRGTKNPENVPSSVDANHDDEQIKCTKLYRDLQQVVEEMDLIKKELMETDWKKAVVQDQRHRFVPASVSSLRSSSKSSMVCSDDVLLGIVEKLVAGGPNRVVIPIVGMGGIGKTTLARTVYSKPHIEDHFDVCAWATISQQYNTKEIICDLLSQANKKRSKQQLSNMSEDELGLELYKYLFGRRYLIVLDDMWDIDAWDRIHRFFPDNDKCGSRVLVTTRLSQLSSHLNNSYSLQMEFLDEVSSWDLFTKTVFGEKISCPSELENIGKKIVENCRGLPLSIVVVGGLLKKLEHTKRSWETIRKNLTSEVNLGNDKHCLRLLKTSYNHLPVHLKPCFLYMGVFEEDAEISVSTLIKLWVCEGFLKPINGKSLEIIGKGFLKDLIDRNLVRIDGLGSTGNVKFCKIHDLLRDLCLNEGKKDGLYHVVGQDCPRGIYSQRRIVIPKNTSKRKVLEELRSTSRARSVISEHGKIPRCRNLGLLRTLHAYKFRKFEDQRYVNSRMFLHVNSQHLAVEVRHVFSFFSSINLLWNIHTLIVSCTRKSILPAEIWKMPQLRHIEFDRKSFYLPDPLGDVVIMENLEILKGVENFKCSEEVIRRIPNIKKLEMRFEGRDTIFHDDCYYRSNIERLCKLESLHIFCLLYIGKVASLYKLTFPHSLKKLTLVMRRGFKWDEISEKIGSLPLLEKLKLRFVVFERGTFEIVEGQFPSLKYLGLFSCLRLKRLIVEDGSVFPCLETIHLFDLKALEEIGSEIGNVATLQKIELQWCSESAVKSAKEIVDEQVELQGEDLPFHVEVHLLEKSEELLSLAGPNFKVDRVAHPSTELILKFVIREIFSNHYIIKTITDSRPPLNSRSYVALPPFVILIYLKSPL